VSVGWATSVVVSARIGLAGLAVVEKVVRVSMGSLPEMVWPLAGLATS
jgi:hypothetical protein